MNKVLITGNLAADPEAYTTQGGVSRSVMRVAVQRRFKNDQGAHDADFFTVVAWRQTADFCNRYLHKGNKVAVEGSMQCRSYEKDGQKRYVWELNADNVESLTGGKAKPESAAKEPEEPQESVPDGFTEVDDSELPF